ncbi:MAG: VTT domain-containing protein [Candidatus Pacearchaeota archaeon]|jgi:membrane protein DedA with SNARE-associated domain
MIDVNYLNLGIVFLWSFLSSLGVPGALLLLVSSGALSENISQLSTYIIIALIAVIIGDITAYTLARVFSIKVAKRLDKYKFYKNGEPRARELLKKYEFFTVFITRFAISGLGAVVSYLSGFERLNRKKFISAVILGEIIYATTYPIIGYIFKDTWYDLVGIINNVLTVIVLILVLIFFIFRRIIKRRKG